MWQQRIVLAFAVIGAAATGVALGTVMPDLPSPAQRACDRLYREALTAADSARVSSMHPFLYASTGAPLCGGGRGNAHG
jgi:hypothetical protein